MSVNPFLIDPRTLDGLLGRPGISIVDASWYLPAEGRDPKAEYVAGHVPGAVFLDLDAVVAPDATLPHTLPSPEIFAAKVGALGISSADTIVVYDGMGLFSAARAWWMLRAFGARDVRILDGGLPAWSAAGHDLETGDTVREPAHFNAVSPAANAVFLDEMQKVVASASAQVVDARSAARFAGTAPEPRAGVRSGHMPGARSLPMTELQSYGRLLSPDALREAFAKAGVDPAAPIVTSCGSGVTAAVINFALASLGGPEGRLYDGSWTEWGSAGETPVETGPAR